jgi:hypothetical protein
MDSYFDRLARELAGGLTRRQSLGRIGAFLGAGTLGLFGLGRRGMADTLANCNVYCRRFPVLSDFLKCRQACLNCPTTSQLCGPTAASLTCCPSGQVCVSGACVPASCADGVQDGQETDVDCGGPDCAPCANGKHCVVNRDCQSGICSNGVCQPRPTCTDGIQNGQETDIDCGGPVCAPCADFKNCLVNRDCQSGICTNGVCQPA